VSVHTDHDIVIIGGGPVGCAAALALSAAHHSVLLLDAASETTADDPRTLALNFGSRLILERLEAWIGIGPRTEIDTIHVSQRGGFGSVVLKAQDAAKPALGYVVSYASMLRTLQHRLSAHAAATTAFGARVSDVARSQDRLTVTYSDQTGIRTVRTQLAILADGGALSGQLAPLTVREYGQSALVCTVSTSKPHRNCAFERFTSCGPLALLPFRDEYAVIWTTVPQRAAHLCTVLPDAFLEELQATFGMRAGNFVTVRDRATFPLALRTSMGSRLQGVIAIGNAAQTLHPVAGQGLNLGLRDAWELSSLLSDPTNAAHLHTLAQRFEGARSRDRRSSVSLTDALVRVFSNDDPALRWLRGCGLTFLDCVPPAKTKFMQQMMFGAMW